MSRDVGRAASCRAAPVGTGEMSNLSASADPGWRRERGGPTLADVYRSVPVGIQIIGKRDTDDRALVAAQVIDARLRAALGAVPARVS